MTITVEVNGDRFEGFTSAQVNLRLDAVADTFSFSATADGPFPFKGGDIVSVFADGEQVTKGAIELLAVASRGREHDITFEGRSLTGDLIDSSLGGVGADGRSLADLKATTMRGLCVRVVSHLGIDVEVIDAAPNAKRFSPETDIAAPEPGDNAFGFLERHSRKANVLLSSDPDGNLLITDAAGVEAPGAFVSNRLDSTEKNNVEKTEYSYDSTGRFNAYKVVTQANASSGGLAAAFNASKVADAAGDVVARDAALRSGRQLVLVMETPSGVSDARDRAKWERAVRRARGEVYSAEVSGFRNQVGALWAVNTIVQVDDDFASLSREMLVNQVTFTTSGSEGEAATVLTFVEKDAYELEIAEPIIETGDASGVAGLAGFFK